MKCSPRRTCFLIFRNAFPIYNRYKKLNQRKCKFNKSRRSYLHISCIYSKTILARSLGRNSWIAELVPRWTFDLSHSDVNASGGILVSPSLMQSTQKGPNVFFPQPIAVQTPKLSDISFRLLHKRHKCRNGTVFVGKWAFLFFSFSNS